jgi:tetratricopeptide (TPR) repeat protein
VPNKQSRLARAVPALLANWTEAHRRRSTLAAYEDVLLDEAADGLLAVLHLMYRGRVGVQRQIENIRLFLDFARHEGYRGERKPLADYETAPFDYRFEDDHDDLADHNEHVTGGQTPWEGDPTAAILMALMLAPSWRVRRHIAAAFPEQLRPNGPVYDSFVERMRASDDDNEIQLYTQLVTALDRAHVEGLEKASPVMLPPVICFGNARANRNPIILSREEWHAFAAQRYLYTTTWKGRIDVLRSHSEWLLSVEACEIIRQAEEDYAEDPTVAAWIGVARYQLEECIRSGVEDAFARPLQPTLVPILPVLNQINEVRNLRDGDIDNRLVEISVLRQAVCATDRDLAPLNWARLNFHLAHSLFSVPDAKVNPSLLEEAIHCGHNSLETFSFYGTETHTIEALIILGVALRERIRGERADNVESSIEYLTEALSMAEQTGELDLVAHAAVELADTYFIRPTGQPPANRAQSERLCRAVLALHANGVNVVHRAQAQIALSRSILSAREDPGDRANWDEAVRHLKDAVASLTPQAHPIAWIGAHSQLAACFMTAPGDANPMHLERAARHLDTALQTCTKDQHPVMWAVLQGMLGELKAKRSKSDPSMAPDAEKHFEAALQVFDRGYPHYRLRILSAIGLFHFANQDWEKCRDVLAETTALGTEVEDFTFSDLGRLVEIGEMTEEYERYAFCLFRLGKLRDAVRELDAGKTRLLRSNPDNPYHDPAGADSWVPESDTDWADLVPPGGALVLPVVTTQGSAVFIVTTAGTEPKFDVVDLESFTVTDMIGILVGANGRTGWLRSYGRWRRTVRARAADIQASVQESTSAEWPYELVQTCKELWLRLMGQVHDHLGNIGVERGAPVVVFPSRGLSLLPLGAAARVVGGKPDYFLDHYSVSYAPSLGVLRGMARRLRALGHAPVDLLAVVDPNGDLPGAAGEWHAIRDIVPSATGLPGSAATVSALTENINGHTHLHFACHGEADWPTIERSSLTLAYQERLEMNGIAKLPLDTVRMVVLSACETGIVESERAPHEFIGLHGAFLSAGVPTVISSLWTVPDEATQLLMEQFYRHHFSRGLPPAAALRAAQRHVSRTDGCAHPYFWAGFFCSGA